MRYRTTLLQNKGISSNSTYFRKTIKTNVLPTTNDEIKNHGLRSSKSRLALLFTSIGITVCILNMSYKPTHKTRRVSLSEGKVIDPNSIEFSLMLSYPDSHSEYISKSITGIATAVNRCEDTEKCKSLFNMNVGPYLSSTTTPTSHILTSTSCGTWPVDSEPKSYYFKTIELFEKDCFSIELVDRQTGDIESKSMLNPTSVKQLLHVVMNPFTNILARYQNYQGKKTGFQNWCRELDEKFIESEESMFSLSEMALMEGVPCHAEFYRFVTWHNFAFGISKYLGLPTSTITVESFREDYDHALEKLLNFLNVDDTTNEEPVPFPRIDDSNYYSTKQRKTIMKLVKRLASDDTWDYVKVYFPEIDDLPEPDGKVVSESDVTTAVRKSYKSRGYDNYGYNTYKSEQKVDSDTVEAKPEALVQTEKSINVETTVRAAEKYIPKSHSFSMDAQFSFDAKPEAVIEESNSVVATDEKDSVEEIEEAEQDIKNMFQAKEKEASDLNILKSIADSQQENDEIYYKAPSQETEQETEEQTGHGTEALYFKAGESKHTSLESFAANYQKSFSKSTETKEDEGFGASYSKLVQPVTSTGVENKKESFDSYLTKLKDEGKLEQKVFFNMDTVMEKYVEEPKVSNEVSQQVSNEVSQQEVSNESKRLTAPVTSENGPKVAWLLTFPSSGTTYTSKLIRMASETTTGTNYGNEYVNADGISVPLYSDINGPYIVDETLEVPSTYILTKTHCGSRCVDCGPKEYIESADDYLEKCLRAPKVVNNTNTREITVANGVTQSLEFVSYDPSLVKKIVHVIKDPYDNIVSRFHHEYKSLVQKFDSKDKFPYSYNKEGFQQYCKDEDEKYIVEEESVYTAKLYNLARNVPCHADFYRYVQWHNHAFSIAQKLNIESHAINYEDYSTKLEDTVDSMLTYLDLPKKYETLAPFKWENAHDHFSKEQMSAVELFVKELASEKTWGYLKDYFAGLDVEESVADGSEEVPETSQENAQYYSQGVESQDNKVDESNASEQTDFKRLTAPVTSDQVKVAWLLTFPSSGTTYTSKLIRQASQTTTGTNYGNEYVSAAGESVSLYSDINGPYIVNETLSVPSTYILTKTHCGSRCMDCGPQEYIETVDTYLEKCTRAPRVRNNVQTKEITVSYGVTQSLESLSYEPTIVKKIVHVIKDPMDNIVSRFHHEYKSIVQKFNSKEEFPYSYDKDGFQEFCAFMDKKYLYAEKQFYSEALLLISKYVPCHSDFYRYVQWHNLAFEVAEKLGIESHVINYEDYDADLEETVTNMLEYLELPLVDKKLAPFKWENAHDHFDGKQLNAIALFVRELASDRTWEYLKDYFGEMNVPDKSKVQVKSEVVAKVKTDEEEEIEADIEEEIEKVDTDVEQEPSVDSDFKRLTAPVTSTNGPRVAWLMTFPSSGTTYTSKLIRMASETTTGTNYGNEYVNTLGESVSLYSDVNGPYIVNETLSVPSTYILTKTHCGSRCVDCGPKDYVEDKDKFLEQCLRAPRVRNDVDTKEVQIANGVTQSLEFLSYDPSLVRKIVHVIKDPFDNIVSRFHHEYKSLVQKFDSKDKFPYEYNKQGFQEFCKDEDKKYLEEEKSVLSQRINLISKHVPCHADFYRYVQWHNLAFEVAEKLNIESHVINYEDYANKLDETVSNMLTYLELPNLKKKLSPFKWESAHDHFDGKQMNAIALYVQELASEKTWEFMKGYFDELQSVDRLTAKEIDDEEFNKESKEQSDSIKEVNNHGGLTAPLNNEDGPKLAWLLSFPESGTTYFTNQIHTTSGYTTATNYGNEYTEQGNSVPLYNDINGPYVVNIELPVPEKYILTKTHCGSRCQDCSPEVYVETFKDYMQQCLQAPKVTTSQLEYLKYEPALVKKIIHLIEDPLDNIVSRFHHESNEKENYTPESFQEFCQEYDEHFTVEDKRIYSPQLLELSKKVPCHGDFYRYVQWHNLAFETADILRIDAHVVHMDKFDEDGIANVLKYLELPKVGSISARTWERKREYYSKEQIGDIRQFVERLASDVTMSHLKRYFD